PFAQQPAGMDQELGAAFEVPGGTRSLSVHDEASGSGAQEECGAVSAHADGCAIRRREAAGDEVLTGELGSGVAGRGCDVRVYVLARGASSRADSDAGEAVGVSDSAECLGTHLAVGSVVEGSGIRYPATLS